MIDLRIAKDWGLTIDEWDDLPLFRKEEYRAVARAEVKKSVFTAAYDWTESECKRNKG